MRLDFLYTTHTANYKTFVIAATAVVVNIIIVFFQSQQKQQNKRIFIDNIRIRTKTFVQF